MEHGKKTCGIAEDKENTDESRERRLSNLEVMGTEYEEKTRKILTNHVLYVYIYFKIFSY